MQIFVSIRFSLLGNNLWCRVHIIFSFIHTHTQWHKFLPFVLRYYQEHVSALNCILYTDILCPNFLSTPFCPVSQSLWTPWSPSYIVWFTRMKKMQIICSETPPVSGCNTSDFNTPPRKRKSTEILHCKLYQCPGW